MRQVALLLSAVALVGVGYLLWQDGQTEPAAAPAPSDPRIDALERDIAELRRLLEKDPRGAPTLLAQDEGQRILQRVDEQITALREEHAALSAKLDALPAATRPTPPPPPPKPAPADPEVVARWIHLLDAKDNDQAFSATIELAKLGDLSAVDGLVRSMEKHRDFYVRLGAATALGQLQATDAMPNLIDALGDTDELVRTAANEAILKITKQDFGFAGGEVADKRRQVQDRIRDWWDEHGNEVAERVRDAR